MKTTTERAHNPNAISHPLADHQQRILVLFRSASFWRWLVVVWCPGLYACAYRAVVAFSFGPILLGAFITAALSVALLQSVLAGVVVSNRGVAARGTSPFRYWASLLLLVAGYGLVILAILQA